MGRRPQQDYPSACRRRRYRFLRRAISLGLPLDEDLSSVKLNQHGTVGFHLFHWDRESEIVKK